MIGNAEDARFIRDWSLQRYKDDPYDYIPGPSAPEGWKRLGKGCFRIAYLSPDGVVYKVERHYGDGWSQSNRGEDKNLRRYRFTKMPEGCRLPRWQYFELDGKGVMAMERFDKLLRQFSRYEGGNGKYYAALSRLSRLMIDIGDFHDANLAVDPNGLLVPIDMGA